MKKFSITNLILLILSLFLCFGSHFVFHGCPAKADGSWMVCHWAERVITALGLVFSLLCLVRFFISDSKIKAGISLTFIPLSILTAMIPGVVVNLCMMKDMRCHTIMRPVTIILSMFILIISVIDCIINIKKINTK